MREKKTGVLSLGREPLFSLQHSHNSTSIALNDPQPNGQPRPQGLLGVQKGGSKETLADSKSRVSKNSGDFDYFKMSVGFVIGEFKVTW